MKNFACWKSDEVYEVINPDVDALPDYIFRAIHTHFPVQLRRNRKARQEIIEPEEFLKRFLEPQDHVMVPVIGESGSGKSHLIRWMRLRLKPDDTREVIFVPKAETNLRDIIITLIERLPKREQQSYLEALMGSGGVVLNPRAQRTAILGAIHLALSNDESENNPNPDDKKVFLLEGLRAAFNDNHLHENHFLKDDGFAAEIAAHVFDKPENYNPTNERREFQVKDLPLDVGNIGRATAKAREFLTFLLAQDNSTKEEAVAIVNGHLDWAIGSCLNLTGDRLIKLMLDIRRHLKNKNKSLILLIEDFARLQGLDRALLQSLIEQKPDLCLLRTAIASTTGFYLTVEETLETRLSFIIDMSAPIGQPSQSDELPRLVSRYMNALRLGKDTLSKEWRKFKGGDVNFDVRNHCEDCKHRTDCHAAFGTIDGYGLYPFTESAIDIMAQRADSDVWKKFNPRQFQKEVLRPIAFLTAEIESGKFPTSKLLEDLGGLINFSPANKNRLEQSDPTNWKRRLTLLQLWNGSGEIVDLHKDIHNAFDLPVLEEGDGPKPPPPPPPPLPPPGIEIDPRLQELFDWDNEKRTLSAPTAQELRDMIYNALREFIDWDEIGLVPSEFMSPTAAFRPAGLYFQKQSTNPTPAIVSLPIPSDWKDKKERYRTVMAMMGLIEAERDKQWLFKEGAEKFAHLQECLRTWAGDVVERLRTIDAGGGSWDPANAAVELRTIAVHLTTPGIDSDNTKQLLQACFGELKGTPDFANSSLNDLVSEIKVIDADLIRAIAVRRSATKGGQVGEFLDAEKLFPVLDSLRERKFIPSDAPEEPNLKTDALRKIAVIARKVRGNLPDFLKEEVNLRRSWYGEMKAAYGQEITQEKVNVVAQTFINAISRLDLPYTNDFLLAKGRFEISAFDQVLSAVGSLPKSGEEQISDITENVGTVMQISRNFVSIFEKLMGRAETEVDAQLRSIGFDPQKLKDLLTQLGEDLSQIGDNLNGHNKSTPTREPIVEATLSRDDPKTKETVSGGATEELVADELLLTLIERNKSLLEKIDRLTQGSVEKANLDKLETRATQTLTHAANLMEVSNGITVLERHGIPLQGIARPSKDLRAKPKILGESLNSDWREFANDDSMFFTFLTPLNTHKEQLVETGLTAWQFHVDEAIPTINEGLLSVIAKTGKSSDAKKLQELLSEVQIIIATIPKDDGTVKKVNELAEGIKNIWGKLKWPKPVESFLEKAVEEDATFIDLTPEVEKWLTKHKIINLLRISLE